MGKPYTPDQIKRNLVSVTVRLPKVQLDKIEVLRKALVEKMGKEMTRSDILEKIIDDFLEK